MKKILYILLTTAGGFVYNKSGVTEDFQKSDIINDSLFYNKKNILAEDDVVTLTGRVWKNKNIGALRVATSTNDYLAYGSLYQWGRESDGHQLINWHSLNDGSSQTGIHMSESLMDHPGHNKFIAIKEYSDWRNTNNDNLWQGVNGVNNPCQSGYRLPTEAEWNLEIMAGNINDSKSAYNSPLKLVTAGFRRGDNASLNFSGSNGYYWSSNVKGKNAKYRSFNDYSTFSHAVSRSNGFSVRCIKD